MPQNRERVFIIGHLRGGSGRKVFPIGGNCTTVKNESEISLADYRYDERLRIRKNGESPCLKANMHKMASDGDLSNAIYVVGTTKSDTAKGTNCRSWVHDPRGIIGAISATDYKQPKQILIRETTKKGYAVAEVGDSINLEQPNSKTRRGRVGKNIANTLTCSCNQGVLDGYRIRKLTPKECWRLQGWDDESFEKAASVCSNSQLYKQAGNGVTVNVIYEIAKRLK